MVTNPSANNFNIIRVLLASLVIFSHSFPMLYGINVFDPIVYLLRSQTLIPGRQPLTAGDLAVYGFFAISGFLVTMSWLKDKNVLNYLKKRILRIYPGYIVTALVCIFILGFIGADSRTTYFRNAWAIKGIIIKNAVELVGITTPPVFTHNPLGTVNGALWSISYEFRCYLTVALLGFCAMTMLRAWPYAVKRLLPLILYFSTYLLYSIHCSGHLLGWLGICESEYTGSNLPIWVQKVGRLIEKVSDPILWPILLIYFFGGMCIYLYRDVIQYRTPFLLGSLLALVLSVYPFHLLAYTLPVFGLYVFMYAAFSTTPRLSSFGKNVDLSYGIYLYGWPAQQMLVMSIGNKLNPYSLFLSSLTAAMLLALVSWHWIEKPFLKLKTVKIV